MLTKGHWPKGQRRHKQISNWSAVLLDVLRLVDAEHKRGVRSRGVLAAAVGVADKTITRWLRGEDVPDEDTQRRVRTWCTEAEKQRWKELRGTTDD